MEFLTELWIIGIFSEGAAGFWSTCALTLTLLGVIAPHFKASLKKDPISSVAGSRRSGSPPQNRNVFLLVTSDLWGPDQSIKVCEVID